LTRLAPARIMPEADMRRSMFHLPLCGLVLGLAVGLLLVLLRFWGLGQSSPLALGWLAALGLAWGTRGLHLDGLSDICDGAAAHVDPERFWAITKDSRVGTFGAAAVALFLLGQVALLSESLRAADLPRMLGILAWVPTFGRACGVLFGCAHRGLIRPGLGGLFLAGATPGAAAWALCLAVGGGLWLGPVATGLAVAGALLLLAPLSRLGRSVGGVNGDFLGASILLGETAAALALALAATP
jgi:adenosylcobinamide-GDP ribazoletransferase